MNPTRKERESELWLKQEEADPLWRPGKFARHRQLLLNDSLPKSKVHNSSTSTLQLSVLFYTLRGDSNVPSSNTIKEALSISPTTSSPPLSIPIHTTQRTRNGTSSPTAYRPPSLSLLLQLTPPFFLRPNRHKPPNNAARTKPTRAPRRRSAANRRPR